ncbi:MAG: hypothetical protein O3B95_06850 [Chloroflexi bacterium]|nr:hypothetical protein [Chloroflexota bacterium]
MSVRPRHFLAAASLLSVVVLSACVGGAEAATGIRPSPTVVPTLTPFPTIVVEVISAAVSSPDSEALHPTGIQSPEPVEVEVLAPSPVPTLTVNRAPEPLPTPTTIAAPGASSVDVEVMLLPTSMPALPPTSTPAPQPTSTPSPTATSQPPTPTPVPATATVIPAPTFNGHIELTGKGWGETPIFMAPANQPWVLEWDVRGTGSNSISVRLFDATGPYEMHELMSDSGTGQLGGATLIYGVVGKIFLRVEGPKDDWTLWIRQQ